MPVAYFKRHRMMIDLTQADLSFTSAQNEIHYLPWSDKLLGHHALAKWESFRNEIDANVFPCLGDRDGCRQLMRDLTQRSNFVPETTWLALSINQGVPDLPAGTIQGLRLDNAEGAIQNIGVVPGFRGRGVGRSLLLLALQGFRYIGCKYVNLEVTIHNLGAIRLYESVGFQYKETVFKVGNVPVSA
jgi:ribosomal protein S18 acetylase RimI-like enzyme